MTIRRHEPLNLQGPLFGAAPFIFDGICLPCAGRLSQEPSDCPLPQSIVCLHEVLCLSQHRPAIPLKPSNALALQPSRGQEGCSRECLLQFPSQARDGAKLRRLSAQARNVLRCQHACADGIGTWITLANEFVCHGAGGFLHLEGAKADM